MAVLSMAQQAARSSTAFCGRPSPIRHKHGGLQARAVATPTLSATQELQQRTSVLDSTDAELDTLANLDDSVLRQLEDLYLAADALRADEQPRDTQANVLVEPCEERALMEEQWTMALDSAKSISTSAKPRARQKRRQDTRRLARALPRHRAHGVEQRAAPCEADLAVIHIPAELLDSQEGQDCRLLNEVLQQDSQHKPLPISKTQMWGEFGLDLPSATVLSREVEHAVSSINRKYQVAKEAVHLLQKRQLPAVSDADLVQHMELRSVEHLHLLQTNGATARSLMLRHNLRLIVHVAQRYADRGVDRSVLVEEGLRGLQRALEKFEPDRGFKFSTYAVWWIRQKIQRATMERRFAIKIPYHVVDFLRRAGQARKHLAARHNGPVSDEMVAQEIGCSLLKVQRSMQVSKLALSLSRSKLWGQDMSEALPQISGTAQAMSHASVPERVPTTSPLAQLLASLPLRESNVLRLHYGLQGRPASGLSLKDIAAMYGVSHERIRKVEKNGIQRLRSLAAQAGIDFQTLAAWQ